MSEEPLSRKFDAALRMIAEDICNHRRCEVGLYEHRHEVRNEGTIEALNRHVIACNSDYRVEAIDRALATKLWNGGVPFKLINNKTGQESWLQLGGGDPGVATCERASQEEVERHRSFVAEAARHRQAEATAKTQLQSFVEGLLVKVRAAAAGAALSAEQRKDFEYFLRTLPECAPLSDYSVKSALEPISQACVVLGITIEELISRQGS